MPVKSPQRKHLALFLSTVGVLLGVFFLVTANLNSFRDESGFDFRTMTPSERIATFMLTRRQAGSLKIGYMERYGVRPEIGLFGNHQIEIFSTQDFNRRAGDGLFFNYTFANLGLPEVRDLFFHFYERKLLPKKLAIVHITTPNNGNGGTIIDHGKELPLDIRWRAMLHYEGVTPGLVLTSFQTFLSFLSSRINYANIMISAMGGNRLVVVDPATCRNRVSAANMPSYVRYIPGSIRMAADFYPDDLICDMLARSLRHDGSSTRREVYSQRKNEDEVDNGSSKLSHGDDWIIANYMRQIADLGERAGIKVVFVILPLYESPERWESRVNKIMDYALDRVSRLNVVDHRRRKFTRNYFIDYDHPRSAYYSELLVREICRKFADVC